MLRLCFFLLLYLSTQTAVANSPVVIVQGNTMGTYYQVRFVGLPPSPVEEKIEALFESVNQKMSTYIPDSALMKFNKSQATDWIKIDTSLVEVALISERIFLQTEGAFDPSVGAIVELWGFGAGLRQAKKPDETKLKALVDKVGYERLQIDRVNSLKKIFPN